MYILTYSSGPAPDCCTFSRIIEASDWGETIAGIRDKVLHESLKMMCEDPPKPPEDSFHGLLRTLVAEEGVDGTFLYGVYALLNGLEDARTNQEDLDACVQAFNRLFDEGNFTDWEFGMKLIADGRELADFVAGDMELYADSREDAEHLLHSHQL